MLDYLYFVIIIFLIGVIIYLIYMSYNYRKNIGPGVDIERFANVVPVINNDLNLDQMNDKIAAEMELILSNYQNLETNIYNKQILDNNQHYIDLLKQMQNNSISLDAIKKKSYHFIPESKSFPINELIKTIKSNYNSQYISLKPDENLNKYGVLVNDKCFTVNGLCKDEFCTLDCQNNKTSSDSQKFYTNRIYSNIDAARIMHTTADQISSKNVYPFNIFRSSVNDKCLNITNDGISVEDCNLNSLSQQWSISPNNNICPINPQ